MKRKKALKKAAKIISGDRDEQYGTPEDSFEDIAQLWASYLSMRFGPDTGYIPVGARDVAIMMILLKIARAGNSVKPDNWVDMIGYAACGCEIETERN